MGSRHRLLALARADRAAADAVAGQAGYPDALRAVHEDNARELELLVDDDGWPTVDDDDEDGVEAALLVAMNAVSRPAFMRRCLVQVRTAVLRGDLPPEHARRLDNRIRALEGHPADPPAEWWLADLDAVATAHGWR